VKRPLVAGLFLALLNTSGNAGNKVAPDLSVQNSGSALDVIVQSFLHQLGSIMTKSGVEAES